MMGQERASARPMGMGVPGSASRTPESASNSSTAATSNSQSRDRAGEHRWNFCCRSRRFEKRSDAAGGERKVERRSRLVAKVEVVIADDEPLARKKLSLLLEKDPEVCLVGECGTVQQTIEAVNGKKPDLLFLDIQMPDGEGFLALEKIAPGPMPVVIFTTAFDQHAVRAFEANALDYLLKPFDETRFVKSLGRAKAYLAATT